MNKPKRVVYHLKAAESDARRKYGPESIYLISCSEEDEQLIDGIDTGFSSFSRSDDEDSNMWMASHLELNDKCDDFKAVTWEGSPIEIDTIIKTEKNYCAGIDMTNWHFDEEPNELLIYKAFIAVCNYAEEHIPCGNCPLYQKLCFGNRETASIFRNKVYEKLEEHDEKHKRNL